MGGGGGIVRYRGVITENSADFRSPEAGISAYVEQFYEISTRPELIFNPFANILLWFKFSFGAKFLKLVQYLFSFVMYSLP